MIEFCYTSSNPKEMGYLGSYYKSTVAESFGSIYRINEIDGF